MLLNESEVTTRLSSPLNLMNRMGNATGKSTAMNLFGLGSQQSNVNTQPQSTVVSLPPSIDQLVDNVQDKIKLGTAHESALDLMVASISILRERINDVDKPEKLASIAADMNKILSSVDNARNKNSNSNNTNNGIQIVVYKPQLVHESEYELITAENG